MAKFTKLNIGDSVASSGGRVWKKLSAESEEVQDELAGTWYLYAPEDLEHLMYYGDWNVNFECNGVSYTRFRFDDDTDFGTKAPYALRYNNTLVLEGDPGDLEYEWKSSTYRTITVTSNLADVADGEALLECLRYLGIKQ